MALAQQHQGQFQQIPSVDQVFTKLNQGHTNITPLEWYCCLQNKAHWDQQQTSFQQTTTAILIWRQIAQDSWLRHFLLRCVLAQCQKIEQVCLAPSLLKTIDTIYEQPWLGESQNLVNLVYGIYRTVVKITDLNNQQPLTDILGYVASRCNLNKSQCITLLCQSLSLSRRDLKLLDDHFIGSASVYFDLNSNKKFLKKHEKWMVSCLCDLEISRQELAFSLTYMLKGMSPEISPNLILACPQLANLLTQFRWQDPELYALLSNQTKLGLNILVYDTIFSQLTRILLNKSPLFQKGDNHENPLRKQIESRCFFWSNYSDRFNAIRILVPSQSYEILEENGYPIQYLERLNTQDTSDEEATEVWLFDFGDYIIAELLRGAKSNIHLIRQTEGRTLMAQPDLSLKQIRSVLSWKHDHMFLWQNFCERWLAERGIFPNDGITQFKQSAQQGYPYSQSKGMPKPSEDLIAIRMEQLKERGKTG